MKKHILFLSLAGPTLALLAADDTGSGMTCRERNSNLMLLSSYGRYSSP